MVSGCQEKEETYYEVAYIDGIYVLIDTLVAPQGFISIIEIGTNDIYITVKGVYPITYELAGNTMMYEIRYYNLNMSRYAKVVKESGLNV